MKTDRQSQRTAIDRVARPQPERANALRLWEVDSNLQGVGSVNGPDVRFGPSCIKKGSTKIPNLRKVNGPSFHIIIKKTNEYTNPKKTGKQLLKDLDISSLIEYN